MFLLAASQSQAEMVEKPKSTLTQKKSESSHRPGRGLIDRPATVAWMGENGCRRRSAGRQRPPPPPAPMYWPIFCVRSVFLLLSSVTLCLCLCHTLSRVQTCAYVEHSHSNQTYTIRPSHIFETSSTERFNRMPGSAWCCTVVVAVRPIDSALASVAATCELHLRGRLCRAGLFMQFCAHRARVICVRSAIGNSDNADSHAPSIVSDGVCILNVGAAKKVGVFGRGAKQQAKPHQIFGRI